MVVLAVVTTPPQNLVATPYSQSGIALAWRAPAAKPSFHEVYRVYYKAGDGDAVPWPTATETVHAHDAIVTGAFGLAGVQGWGRVRCYVEAVCRRRIEMMGSRVPGTRLMLRLWGPW